MGFTLHEKKTPVPPNAGSGIQSYIGMLNFISWGVRSVYGGASVSSDTFLVLLVYDVLYYACRLVLHSTRQLSQPL